MPKPNKAKFKDWETGGKSNRFSRVSEDMQKSEAFRDLSKKQTDLYLFACRQQFCNKKPYNDYPDLKLPTDAFYLNRGIVLADGLYKETTIKNFYNDVNSLVEHGFIKVISNGKSNHKKNIYMYSRDWLFWKKT